MSGWHGGKHWKTLLFLWFSFSDLYLRPKGGDVGRRTCFFLKPLSQKNGTCISRVFVKKHAPSVFSLKTPSSCKSPNPLLMSIWSWTHSKTPQLSSRAAFFPRSSLVGWVLRTCIRFLTWFGSFHYVSLLRLLMGTAQIHRCFSVYVKRKNKSCCSCQIQVLFQRPCWPGKITRNKPSLEVNILQNWLSSAWTVQVGHSRPNGRRYQPMVWLHSGCWIKRSEYCLLLQTHAYIYIYT